AYCSNCGNPVNEDQDVCLQCGNQLKVRKQIYEASGTFGWAVLGFFVPIAGLVLYLAWKENKPKNAKSAGIGGLVGFLVGVVYIVSMMISQIPEIGNLF
ncbi:MAG: PLDc N-terminal domain-containing protein, partial [Bacillota bacterium]